VFLLLCSSVRVWCQLDRHHILRCDVTLMVSCLLLRCWWDHVVDCERSERGFGGKASKILPKIPELGWLCISSCKMKNSQRFNRSSTWGLTAVQRGFWELIEVSRGSTSDFLFFSVHFRQKKFNFWGKSNLRSDLSFNRSLTEVWPRFLRDSTLITDVWFTNKKWKPFGRTWGRQSTVRFCQKSVWPRSNRGWTRVGPTVEPSFNLYCWPCDSRFVTFIRPRRSQNQKSEAKNDSSIILSE
jgi:hypothetical protein